MTEKLWIKATQVFLKAGKMPLPVTDTMASIIKELLTEEQAKFMLLFKKRSYTLDEIKEKTDLDDEALNQMLDSLQKVAAITKIPSKSTGTIIYYVSPYMPGMLEFEFMKGKKDEKQMRLAKLDDEFFNELIEGTQKNYDTMVPMMKNFPPVSRTVPVEEEIEKADEMVLPLEEVSKIIEQSNFIGVGTCYCKHGKDLLGNPCKITNERKICFTLGRSGQFLKTQGFVEQISKEEALKILKKCEEDGLVHKVIHSGLDPNREIDAICNCCKCCCGILALYHRGGTPLNDLTSHLAKVNEDECQGCGTCVENCNVEAIELKNEIAFIDENVCIGCGICVRNCPSNAIKLIKTELRHVFVPPPKLKRT